MKFVLLTVFLTLIVSSFCSLLEALVLGTTSLDIETVRKKSKKKGDLLESLIENIGQTTSAVLTLNTIANTFGATLAGILYAKLHTDASTVSTYIFPLIMTVSILFFSEILPKNIGIAYKQTILPISIYPLSYLCKTMSPISKVFSKLISFIIQKRADSITQDEETEIKLLAEKGAKEGSISVQEKNLISNALSLDDIYVSDIMTPRPVVMMFEKNETIASIFNTHADISFSRIPVYDKVADNVVGVCRRRDLLLAKAKDNDETKVSEFTSSIPFVPETGSALVLLKQLVKAHQRMAAAVDEFGGFVGVVTLEDIFEHLIGSEIFEKDDIAVDMRELARKNRDSKISQK